MSMLLEVFFLLISNKKIIMKHIAIMIVFLPVLVSATALVSLFGNEVKNEQIGQNEEVHIDTPPVEVEEVKKDEVKKPVVKPPTPAVAKEAKEEPKMKALSVEVKPVTDIDQLLKKHFGNNWVNAKKIMMCESSGRADAKGDVTIQYRGKDGVLYGASYGLFQIRYLEGRPTPSKLVNPEFNVEYAAGMYKAQGHWRAWYNCAKKTGLL